MRPPRNSRADNVPSPVQKGAHPGKETPEQPDEPDEVDADDVVEGLVGGGIRQVVECGGMCGGL